uniref:Uncharacterized protein n=1 Tax=Colobus angolensis palliatus TaxID=336983 RepID=A0A2K5HHV6_COLAP
MITFILNKKNGKATSTKQVLQHIYVYICVYIGPYKHTYIYMHSYVGKQKE